MEIAVYLAVFFVVVIFFGYQSVQQKKRFKEELNKKLQNMWGKKSDREYKGVEFQRIRQYFELLKRKDYIDDITWNDLGMDNIFKSMNYSMSSIGEECLYDRLRRMDYTAEDLKEFDRVTSFLNDNPDVCREYMKCFVDIGRAKSISVYDFIHRLTELGKRKNTKHYILMTALLVSIGMIFVVPVAGIIGTIVMVCINVIQYYRIKAEIENYFICCGYIVGIIVHGSAVSKFDVPELRSYSEEMKEICNKLKPVVKNVYLIGTNNMSGSIAEMLMEYVRMLFHVDLIKFNSILKDTIRNIDEIDRLYEIIGYLESACCTAYYRAYLENEYGYYCKPYFIDNKFVIQAKEIYHPLISKPVSNSITEEKCVLLTGSNASGKSTFLKTVGINAILSQTLSTSTGKEFMMKRQKVYSSMSLKDDLLNNESYYMVEIKSLKRIIDAAKAGEDIICFVDEVLRGTNTVERVSASTEILKSFADGKIEKVLCFAATHDIELTYLLKDWYSNYHFEETVVEDDVLFNYKLNEGPATSRNAIQLLKVIGYDANIIEAAKTRADNYVRTGKY